MEKLELKGEYIKLEQLLKVVFAFSGGEAKNIIADGNVLVNGEIETRRGKKLHKGDIVILDEQEIMVV